MVQNSFVVAGLGADQMVLLEEGWRSSITGNWGPNLWEVARILMRGRLLIKSTKLSWWGIGGWGSIEITLWVWRI